MAYLTGLGSGRVQSTAGAALTMTAPWQVYLRWSCLMCAHPLLLFPPFAPIHHLHHSFIIPSSPGLFLSPLCHSPLPWLLRLLPFSHLIISLSALLSVGLTETYYLLSVCSQAFAHSFPPTHLSYRFKIFSQLSSQFDPSASSRPKNNCVHEFSPL